MNRYAVIDLGTNTFHLLIAERGTQGEIKEIFRDRRFVKLAEEGIESIGQAPFQRGLDTLVHFRQVLAEHAVAPEKARIFGTAALRTASNGDLFIQEVFGLTGIKITLISGGREAELIYKGVALAVQPMEERMLIMDIGGGSVEFIIADKQGVLWAHSFPVGVAVLYRQFHAHEPIQAEEVAAEKLFLSQQLQPLQLSLTQYPCQRLVGASGTFDVLDHFLARKTQNNCKADIPVEGFFPFFQKLLKMSDVERRQMEGLPHDRVDMIVVALILIDVVVGLAQIKCITVSAYAMKEGMLCEMMEADFPHA